MRYCRAVVVSILCSAGPGCARSPGDPHLWLDLPDDVTYDVELGVSVDVSTSGTAHWTANDWRDRETEIEVTLGFLSSDPPDVESMITVLEPEMTVVGRTSPVPLLEPVDIPMHIEATARATQTFELQIRTSDPMASVSYDRVVVTVNSAGPTVGVGVDSVGGRVVSEPPGLECWWDGAERGTCRTQDFARGTPLTLRVEPDEGYVQRAWSGPGECAARGTSGAVDVVVGDGAPLCTVGFVAEPPACGVTATAWGQSIDYGFDDILSPMINTAVILDAGPTCLDGVEQPEISWRYQVSQGTTLVVDELLGTGQSITWVVQYGYLVLEVADPARRGAVVQGGSMFVWPRSTLVTLITAPSETRAGDPVTLVVLGPPFGAEPPPVPVMHGDYADEIGSVQFELWRNLGDAHYEYVDGATLTDDRWMLDEAATASLSPGDYEFRTRCLDRSGTGDVAVSPPQAWVVTK